MVGVITTKSVNGQPVTYETVQKGSDWAVTASSRALGVGKATGKTCQEACLKALAAMVGWTSGVSLEGTDL